MGSKERKRWLAANMQEERSIPAGPHTKRATELGTRSLAAAMSELKEFTVEQERRDKENMESNWVSRSRAIKARGTRVASYTFERGLRGRDKGRGHSDDESSDSDSDLSQRISWLQSMPLSQVLHPPHGAYLARAHSCT